MVSRARRPHDGPDRRRRLPAADRRLAARGRVVRQVPRRQPDQRRGRRGALRAPRRRDHPHGRGPVRRVPARRAAAASASTTASSRRSPGLPTPVDVLRDLPARRLPAVLLPRARRRRTSRSAPTSSTSTRSARRASSGSRSPASRRSRAARATLAALEARGRPGITVLDLDYRPMFWELARGGPRVGRSRRSRTSPSRSATSTSARPRSASASRARPRRCASAASSSRSSSRARRACSPTTATSGSRCRPCRSRSSTASAPATRSAARSATGCWPAGTSSAMMRFCNAAGALVASRLACADAMPERARGRGPARGGADA